jgi:hypothetical protein
MHLNDDGSHEQHRILFDGKRPACSGCRALAEAQQRMEHSNLEPPRRPWWLRLWHWLTGKHWVKFDCTVGTGADYPNVQTAIDAGAKRILLVSDEDDQAVSKGK